MIQLYFLLTMFTIVTLICFLINSIAKTYEEERRLIRSVRRHYILKSIENLKPKTKEHIQISNFSHPCKQSKFLDVG